MFKKKERIVVPKGVRYLGEWEDFSLDNFPNKCIINKQIPGCGFTEFCLRNDKDCVICLPRIMLIKNKWEQHKGDVYRVVNEYERKTTLDKNLEGGKKSADTFLKEMERATEHNSSEDHTVYTRVLKELKDYFNLMDTYGKPKKILVTYDSFRIVLSALIALGVVDRFGVLIDEFQSILQDSRFKSGTEIEFLKTLEKSKKACFVSATPMLDEYIEMLDEFKDLPYYELDWGTADPGRIVKPGLKVLTMRGTGEKMCEVIQTYLDGKFEKTYVSGDNNETIEVESREAVFYVNSVNHIINSIKKKKLSPDQVNILCADTDYNQNKIWRKLGKEYDIGSVPLKGDEHKMFTFCTRTVYIGSDFYSRCARTFIFSDSNIDSLSVDISEDLPQILGRQRLKENPWKNQATFYYRHTCDYRKISQEDFAEIIKKKEEETNNLLKAWESGDLGIKSSLSRVYKNHVASENYKQDYVTVNRHASGILVPVFNNLVLVSELRAFKIQQFDYKDRFTVFSTLSEVTGGLSFDDNVTELIGLIESAKTYKEKMKLLCESNLPKESIEVVLDQLEGTNLKSHYLALGPEKLKSVCYNITKVNAMLSVKAFSKDDIRASILSEFKVGDRLMTAEIKKKLQEIYDRIGYKSKAKATDLKKYFKVKDTSLLKKVDGKTKTAGAFELLEIIGGDNNDLLS